MEERIFPDAPLYIHNCHPVTSFLGLVLVVVYILENFLLQQAVIG